MRLGGGLPARVRYGYQPRLSTSQTIVYGASRDRTGDLLLAKQALSQLSYGPAPPSVGQQSPFRSPDIGALSTPRGQSKTVYSLKSKSRGGRCSNQSRSCSGVSRRKSGVSSSTSSTGSGVSCSVSGAASTSPPGRA